MKAIIKRPGEAPESIDVADGSYETLRKLLGAEPGSCITGDGVSCLVRVWCDDDALRKTPRPSLNLVRPSDGAPIHGTVVAMGDCGGDAVSLDDRECALWMSTLALIGHTGDGDHWRSNALCKLEPLIHSDDRARYEDLRRRVA